MRLINCLNISNCIYYNNNNNNKIIIIIIKKNTICKLELKLKKTFLFVRVTIIISLVILFWLSVSLFLLPEDAHVLHETSLN